MRASRRAAAATGVLFATLLLPSWCIAGRQKDALQYGGGLIVNVPFPESDVARIVQDVVQNGIIRGTKEYNKDEYVMGATAVSSTRVFPEWNEGGKVFYKVRLRALDPRNFKDSGDVGTLAVRYVVQPQDEKHTVLRIEARFVEDFRHSMHVSNGSVENAEYKDIHDRLDTLAAMKLEATDAASDKRESSSNQTRLADAGDSSNPSPAPAATEAAVTPPTVTTETATPLTLEQHVKELRRQVERLVKAPGAPLKSAPFHTATTLQSLAAGTEVLVVISTPYWLGVETHDGEHGWMLRDELDLLP